MIAVIGKESYLIGFQLVGIENIFKIDNGNKKKANELVEQFISEKKYKLIIMDEDVFSLLNEYLKDKVIASTDPLFFVLSKEKEQDESLKLMMKRALGVDIENI